MRHTLDKPSAVLYHAVSSYQLLEVMLHRMVKHPRDQAVLLLPDFIVGKYPQYKKLSRRFFDRVWLFPYLQIPHKSEEQVLTDTGRFGSRLFPRGLSAFSTIYVAGAHFYFSLYLIQNGLPFTMFEDAAGMFSRPEVLRTRPSLQISAPCCSGRQVWFIRRQPAFDSRDHLPERHSDPRCIRRALSAFFG